MEDVFQDRYEALRTEAQLFYGSAGSVFSPLFQKEVHFTAEGFNHILFTHPRSERDRASQIARFSLLPLAIKLIGFANIYQEYEENVKEFPAEYFGIPITKIQLVRYWGIIAIIDNHKFKVVVRSIGENGALHFWSVIPGWVTGKQRDAKLFKGMKGNPETD